MSFKKSAALYGIFSLALISELASARTISNVEVFRRCYAQLTQQSIKYNDDLLNQVRVGSKTPAVACMEVLDRAKFVANGGNSLLVAGNGDYDGLGAKVLNMMNQLHQTFFLERNFQLGFDPEFLVGLQGIYDPGEPALFYTKALFGNQRVDSVMKSNENLRANRTDNNPANGPLNGTAKAETIFAGDSNFTWAPVGSLLGVSPTGLMPFGAQLKNSNATVNAGATRGGGILGSPAYLLETVKEDKDFLSNTLKMPRKWAKAVFADFLCRQLPVIDGNTSSNKYLDQFVEAGNGVHEFRKSASCVQCHASMDRLAGVNRNFKYLYQSSRGATGNDVIFGGIFPVTVATNTTSAYSWPATVDNKYSAKSTRGVLYYKNSDGKLVDEPLVSISDLGVKLAAQDDFYYCAAKRYYKYFTGVDVNFMNTTPSALTKSHFDNVRNLGLNLKKNQSLRTMINNIINLPAYKQSMIGN